MEPNLDHTTGRHERGQPRATFAGEKGHALRTTDLGETWEVLPLPTQPNATVWGLATHPADANRIVAFSLFGEVYVSEDAGASFIFSFAITVSSISGER